IGSKAYRPDGVAPVVCRSLAPGLVAESRTAPDGVIQSHLVRDQILAHPDAPDTPSGRGEIPAFRRPFERANRTIVDVGTGVWVERDRRQAVRLLAGDVEKAYAPLSAVIVEIEIRAVGCANAVDHAGLKVGNEDLLVDLVKRHVSE